MRFIVRHSLPGRMRVGYDKNRLTPRKQADSAAGRACRKPSFSSGRICQCLREFSFGKFTDFLSDGKTD